MAEAKKTTKKEVKEAELVVEAAPVVEEVKPEKKTTAKAGKRSAKATKEAEEKQAKEERKTAEPETQAESPKQARKPARSKLEKQGKKLREAVKLVDKTKNYELKEAAELAIKTSPVKFDATVELHVNLNVDPKQADQNIRGVVVLPAGTGKQVKIAVFADSEDAAKATKAGADIAGEEVILKLLEKGTLDFDILIASPLFMPKLGKYAKLLGPKGLMPNPKSGTVSKDVTKAVSEAKAGRVEYRVDSTGIIHCGVGKVSFGTEKLLENISAVISSIKSAKPASVKSGYIKSSYLTTSMGPSIKLSL